MVKENNLNIESKEAFVNSLKSGLSGEYYETEVPDTLDLAERAGLAINGSTGILDPDRNYMPFHYLKGHRFYHNSFRTDPEGPSHEVISGDQLWGKQIEPLLKMRLMSGSMKNIDIDALSIIGMIDCIDDTGIYWAKVDGDGGEDHAPLYAQARVMIALITLYRIDPNPKCLELIERLAKGFSKVAVHKSDYAYYPDPIAGSLCMPRTGWKNDDEPQGLSYTRDNVDWGLDASIMLFSYGGIVRALCQWYELSGNPEVLAFAGKLVNFMRKDRFWQPEANPAVITPSEQGQFEGHLHASIWGLWALLDYGILVGNEQLKDLARRGYEYSRTLGNISRIGMFSEGCTVGDITNLAIRLSESGVGDYWDDVDLYVRNQLTEIHAIDREKLKQAGLPEDIIDRQFGNVLTHAINPTSWFIDGVYCCDENVKVAYYKAWESIVRIQGDHARINLLLNRASPWLDIDSYLPYEGKVVIRNKTARQISIRLPGWVEAASVKVMTDNKPIEASQLGNWLLLTTVSPGQTISLSFPVKERIEHYRDGWEGVNDSSEFTMIKTIPIDKRTVYTIRFRGNTVVDIQPRQGWNSEILQNNRYGLKMGYHIYDRNHLLKETAPMKKITRYIRN